MSKTFIKVGMAAALIVGATSFARAMDEQRMAPTEAPAAAAAAPEASPLGVQDGAQVRKQESGTEIRIPGLGKVGTLPKMDFGLELLYGVAESKEPTQENGIDENQDDLTIRGSVKHKF